MDKNEQTIATVREAFASGAVKRLRNATGTTLAQAVAGIRVTNVNLSAMAWSSWERGAVPSPSYALAVAPVLEHLHAKEIAIARVRAKEGVRDLRAATIDLLDVLMVATDEDDPDGIRWREFRKVAPELAADDLQAVVDILTAGKP